MGRRSKQRKRKHDDDYDEAVEALEEDEAIHIQNHKEKDSTPTVDFIPVARLSKEQTEYSKNLLQLINNSTVETTELDFEQILKELEGKEESYMCDYYGSLLLKEILKKKISNNPPSSSVVFVKDLLQRLNLRNLLLNVHACKVLEEILIRCNGDEEVIDSILKSLSENNSGDDVKEIFLFYAMQKFSVHFIRLLVKSFSKESSVVTSVFRRKELIFHQYASIIVQELMDVELLRELKEEDLYEISLNPIASFYLQKWLEQDNPYILLLHFPYDKLYPMSMNQYGNYIVQKLLDCIEATSSSSEEEAKDKKELVAKYLLNRDAINNLLKNDRLNVVYKLTNLFHQSTEKEYSDKMFDLILEESNNCILLQCALLKYKQYEPFISQKVLKHPEYATKREESHLITTYFLYTRDKRRTKREFSRSILNNFGEGTTSAIRELAMNKYGSRVLESFQKSGCLEVKDLQDICSELLKSKALILGSLNARKVYETYQVEMYSSNRQEWLKLMRQ